MSGAAGIVCRRGGKAFGFRNGSSIENFNLGSIRSMSELVKSNGKQAFLVDTLALVRKLENQGVPSKQAEAFTSAITEVLNDSIENVARSFATKGEMEKSAMLQESHISAFRTEVLSAQETHYNKMRSELRHEIDKVTSGQRLDINLERGRITDELAKQNTQISELSNKFDREILTLRSQMEAGKFEVMKYCIGTLVSLSAFGLAIVRVLM